MKPLFALLALMLACSPAEEAADTSNTAKDTASPGNPVNVVVIVADALRQDILGCYGGEAFTPNIDELAASGVLFDNAFTNHPWTAPSTVAMLTGNYGTSYGHTRAAKTVRIHVPDREVMLAEVLQEKGYTTLAALENLVATMQNAFQGFEVLPSGREYRNATTERARAEVQEIIDREINHPPYWDLFVAMGKLLDMAPDQKFMMFYWMLDPHEPYVPAPDFKDRIAFDRSELPKLPRYYEGVAHRSAKLSEIEHEYLRKLYIAEVESVDERVGFIIETLRRRDLLDSTYVIFTSDHGEFLGDRGGQWGHPFTYYDVTMRIPMIVTGPDVPKGVRRNTSVSLVDLTPTLADLLGVKFEEAKQGRSIRPELTGDDDTPPPVYFSNIVKRPGAPGVHVDAILDGVFKLIDVGDGFELYNLQTDREEKNNLAADLPDVVQRMHEQLKNHRAANKLRVVKNTSEPSDTASQLTDEEIRETEEKLRALGYIK